MSDQRTNGRPGDDSSVITKSRSETKKPSMYKVLLLNDDYTPMEFVVIVLMRFFGMDEQRATTIMLQIGRASCRERV